MPTVLAHAAVGGAVAALAPAGVSPRRLGVAAALCAALPDLDVLAFAVGIPYAHPLGHRGLSHGLPFALLLGLAAAPLVVSGGAWAPWVGRRVALLLAAATASHGLLDAATDAGLGVGLLLPFDARRFFWPWRPLPTAPIGVGAFLRGDVAGLLGFEACWLAAPAWLAAAAVAGVRRGRASPPRGAAPR